MNTWSVGVMGLAPAADPLEDGHLVSNHLGPFLLTNLLLEVMVPGGRVVNVASRAHFQASTSTQLATTSDVVLGSCRSAARQ